MLVRFLFIVDRYYDGLLVMEEHTILFLDWEESPHFLMLGDQYFNVLQAYVRKVLDLDDKVFIHNIQIVERDIENKELYEQLKKFFIEFCERHDKIVNAKLEENERVLLKYGEVRYENLKPLYNVGGFINESC